MSLASRINDLKNQGYVFSVMNTKHQKIGTENQLDIKNIRWSDYE
jgi:hypothetical protein